MATFFQKHLFAPPPPPGHLFRTMQPGKETKIYLANVRYVEDQDLARHDGSEI